MKRRCLDCPTLISKGSRCRPCDTANRGTWRQRAAFRLAVLTRDDFTCVRCGLVDPTGNLLAADHVRAISNGGSPFDLNNGQTLCRAENRAKGSN